MIKKTGFVKKKDSLKLYAINDLSGIAAIKKVIEKHKNHKSVTLMEKEGSAFAVFHFGPHVFGSERKMLMGELIDSFYQALKPSQERS